MIGVLILAQLVATDRVTLPGRTIRVTDVVGGARSTRSLAELPRTSRSMTLSRTAIVRLARRAGIEATPGAAGAIVFVPAAKPRAVVRFVPAKPAVARGASLEVAASAGPVRIVRAVTAMEDGRAGHRLFVRDADGQVFAAAVSEAVR